MQLYKGGKQYNLDDLKVVFEQEDFSSWDEMVNWLEANGRPIENLDDAKVGEMIFDLKKVRDEDFPFTSDYKRVFDLMQM